MVVVKQEDIIFVNLTGMPEFILCCLMDKWLVQFKHLELTWMQQPQNCVP